jgi:hypothetical protein
VYLVTRPFLFVSQIPAHHGVSSSVPQYFFYHDSVPHHRLRNTEPSDLELKPKPLKLGAKINLSFLKLFSQAFCYGEEKLTEKSLQKSDEKTLELSSYKDKTGMICGSRKQQPLRVNMLHLTIFPALQSNFSRFKL